MDLAEPENRREPGYSRTRFEGSGAPAPGQIRTFDGHIQPFKIERELDYDEDVDLTNIYHCGSEDY